MRIPGVISGSPIDIDRTLAMQPEGVIPADIIVTPVVIAFEDKFENSWVIHSFVQIAVEEGDKDPFLERLIALFGDHDHYFTSGNPFPKFQIVIHIDRKHRAGGFAQIFIDVIKVDVGSAGISFYPKSSIDLLCAQQADAQYEADHDDGSHFHDNLPYCFDYLILILAA